MTNNRTVGLFARRAGSLVWRTISILSFMGCVGTLILVFQPGHQDFLTAGAAQNAVCDAARQGHTGRLARFSQRQFPLDAPCYNGQFTPLSAAASHGRVKAVAFLLAKGVAPDNHGTDGRTPLTLAQLHLFQGFRVTADDLRNDRDFARTSQILAQAGGTTGNARPLNRVSRNPFIRRSDHAEIRRYAFP